jgi:hypothetical protein
VDSGILHLAGKLLSNNDLPYLTRNEIWQAMDRQRFRFVCAKAYYNFMLQQIPEATRSAAILTSIKRFSFKTMLFNSFCLASRFFPFVFKFISAVLLARYKYLEKKQKDRARLKYGRLLCGLRPYFNSISAGSQKCGGKDNVSGKYIMSGM